MAQQWFRKVGRAAGFVLPAIVWGSGPAAASYSQGGHGPTVMQRYTHPVLYWDVRGINGSRVTGLDFLLNGTRVPADYSFAAGRVQYVPQELPPGAYHAACRVILDDRQPVIKEWDFSVAADALRELPAPTTPQMQAFNAANEYRRGMGLPPFQLDLRLCAAAQSHSDYARRNKTFGHDETPGNPGFTGARSSDRIAAFGGEGGGEDMSGGQAPAPAVSGLIDAPYHRLPFMEPGPSRIGIGVNGTIVTLDFQSEAGEGTIVYPVDGQTGVPVAWNGGESPNPLRIHGLQGTVGYALAYSYHTVGDSRIRVTGASLTDERGAAVPICVNSAFNDDHIRTNAAFIIPRGPLNAGRGYTATITAYNVLGQNVSRTWSFTTGGAASAQRPWPARAGQPVVDAKRDAAGRTTVWVRNPDQGNSRHVILRLHGRDGALLAAAYATVPAGRRRAFSLRAPGAVTVELVSVDAEANPLPGGVTVPVRAPVGNEVYRAVSPRRQPAYRRGRRVRHKSSKRRR